MIRLHRTAAYAALLALCACTNLDTRPGYVRSHQNSALPGVEYSLPMLQYQVDLSYRIDKCPDDGPLSLVVKAVAAPTYVAGESYTVNYAALSSVMKTSDFTIQTAKGSNILVAINASADDKTADVIKSAAELALKVASIASPVPMPELVLPQGTTNQGVAEANTLLTAYRKKRQRLVCTQTAKDALISLGTANTEAGRLTKLINAGTKEIDQITTRAKLRLATRKDRLRIAELQTSQIRHGELLAAEQELIDGAQKKLAFADSPTWPESPSQFDGDIEARAHFDRWAERMFELRPTEFLDVRAVRAVMTRRLSLATTKDGKVDAAVVEYERLIRSDIEDQKAALKGQCNDGESIDDCSARAIEQSCAEDENATACLRRHVAVSAELEPAAGKPLETCDSPPVDLRATCLTEVGAIAARRDIEHKGIFIRPPVRARLILCRKLIGCAGRLEGPLYRSGWDTAPQLGQLRFLPFRNKAFQSNALVLALREDGSIEKLQYTDKVAVAAAATASLAGVATSVDTWLQAREKEERDNLLQARADAAYGREQLLNRRADVKYERDEAAARRAEAAAVRVDEIAQIQHQIDLVTKQKARIAAEDPAVAQSYLNETAWLDAQLAQLRSRMALLKAEDEFAKQNAPASGT